MNAIAQTLLAVAAGQRPPFAFGDEPRHATMVIASDARRIFQRWWPELQRCGWDVEAVFGGDDHRPWARIDRQGLCWHLADGEIVEIAPDFVVIKTATFRPTLLTFRRR